MMKKETCQPAGDGNVDMMMIMMMTLSGKR